jgi:two-component system cell cycle response regulator
VTTTINPTILLADDEVSLRIIYAESLRRAGYHVIEASDGREALAQVALCPPALLILDAWMPDINGFEVLDALRHDPAVSMMKVVMFSNIRDGDSRLEGFSSGLLDWWVKGLDLDAFLAQVRRVLDESDVASSVCAGPGSDSPSQSSSSSC